MQEQQARGRPAALGKSKSVSPKGKWEVGVDIGGQARSASAEREGSRGRGPSRSASPQRLVRRVLFKRLVLVGLVWVLGGRAKRNGGVAVVCWRYFRCGLPLCFAGPPFSLSVERYSSYKHEIFGGLV